MASHTFTRPAKQRANKRYYAKHRDVLKAKEKERYWRLKLQGYKRYWQRKLKGYQ